MANLITTTTSGLTSNRLSEYYSKILLKHQIDQERLVQFCTKYDLPAHAASTTMRMYKRSKASASDVETLSEGAPSATYSNSTLTPVDVTLIQVGEKVKISDTRQATDMINQLNLETARMGEGATYKADEMVRDAIVKNNMYNSVTAITSSGWNRFVGGSTLDEATQAELETRWDTWKAGTAANLKLKVSDLRAAVTSLRLDRAQPLEAGYYCAAVDPSCAHDLQSDSEWQAVNTYQGGGERIYKGEIGKIAGCKVMDWTLAFKQASTAASFGTFAAAGNVYTTFVFGKEAVGTMKLAGSGSPLKPKMYILNTPDKSDPSNQFTVASWKGYFASEVLDKTWVKAIHSKSTYEIS